MKTFDQIRNEMKSTSDDFKMKVLINNYIAAMYSDELIETVKTAFNGYQGKKIGPKTMEKINEKIQEIYPTVRVYIHLEYDNSRRQITIHVAHDSAHFVSYEDDVTINMKRSDDNSKGEFFDENNNFIGITNDNVWIRNRKKYIEDIDTYIETKKALFEKLHELEKDYATLSKQFEENRVKGLSDMPYLIVPNYITKF